MNTGQELDAEMATSARRTEMKFFRDMGYMTRSTVRRRNAAATR